MKTAIYARVSTDDQNLESQLAECRNWCKNLNLTATEYLDKISGSSTSREALDRMMADVRRGKIKTVVCYKLDRLGRSLVHLSQMIGEFRSHGVALVCPSQGIDTRASNPCATFQMHVLMAVAEFEKALIVERTNAGLKAARARGVTLGRPRGTTKLNIPVAEARAAITRGETIRGWAREHGFSEGSVRRALRAEG